MSCIYGCFLKWWVSPQNGWFIIMENPIFWWMIWGYYQNFKKHPDCIIDTVYICRPSHREIHVKIRFMIVVTTIFYGCWRVTLFCDTEVEKSDPRICSMHIYAIIYYIRRTIKYHERVQHDFSFVADVILWHNFLWGGAFQDNLLRPLDHFHSPYPPGN